MIASDPPRVDEKAAVFEQLRLNGGDLQMSMRNGALEFRLNGVPLGEASDTTGAQGALVTSVMADQLLALASQIETDGGDSALAARLRALAITGRDLAQVEDAVHQARVSGDTAAMIVTDVTDPDSLASKTYAAHWRWTDAANEAIQWMKAAYPTQQGDTSQFADARIQQTFDRLNVYAEGIDTVGNVNFISAPGLFFAADGKTPPLTQLLGKTVANADTRFQNQVNVSGITLDIAPTFTEATANRIARAGQEASGAQNVVAGYAGGALPN